ncbi:PREDICTED: venom carboxylesterase-6-like [Wasmannia auropunctata]|uniref:venom carboxylesterase-6-like n=1 Tax=Wasmannia auropunctata TaxID=64793 RepID=UPI0005F0631F|nr:PREDICTED: venom carboxylesterase-6-like [Wasmannia auropunctata]XP_011689097.1 PREDICTED: venom carboxylesterase-6-like [Wasmannia auropunctata]XP_011689098.1 PREDICTED: venom carboxylesterase-6-like [Wasmannia auropunctata]
MREHRNNLLIQFGFICIFALNANIIYGDTIAKTPNGILHGKRMPTRLGRNINAFLGIPYAAPPVGELRFKPPQPPTAWNGTLDATKNAEICTQRNVYVDQKEIVGNEDCLYLNVYTPCLQCTQDHSDSDHHHEHEQQRKAFARFPVMIWFHGGGWLTGAGHSEFYGHKFLLDFDLVLVTINFRLGPLGFLSTEDLECPGNLGLKDQQQAMRWVHENIVYFSGDPNKVTLFGESAGGASVHYHMVSPLSAGLFHRGISQSGNFYNPWTLASPGVAKMRAMTLGKNLGCNSENSKELIKCLQTKSAEEIIGTDQLFKKFGYCPMIPFRPVIEPKHPGAFLIEDPLISVREGRLLDIPWMTGITSEEGTLRVAGIYGRENNVKELEKNFNEIAPISLLYGERYNIANEDLRNEISATIHDFYFGYKAIDHSDDSRFKVINMYSDYWFNHGTHEAVQDFIVNQTSPVFYYYFAYRGSASFSTIFGDRERDYGVSHADDLQYLFPVGEQLFTYTTLSDKDQEMIDVMTDIWYNFANSGNPTPKVTKVIPLKWKPVKTAYAPEYLRIESPTNIIMDHSLLWERMIFWDSLTRRMKSQDNTFRHLKDEL